MNDLISRARAIREISDGVIEVTTPDNDRRPQEAVEDYRAVIIKYLLNVPAADPVKHGKWLEHQQGLWVYAKCSKCETIHDIKSNYCPNCGAKMTEGAEE